MKSPTFRVSHASRQRDGYWLVIYRDGKITRQATHFGEIAEGDQVRIVSGLAVKASA